jgi:mono/diheme cytochrome c family protein
MHLHWDGDNDSVDERNLSAALGAGVTPVTVDHDNLKRVRDWIWTLPAPTYPYRIDAALASRGAPIYRESCANCHGDHRFRDGVISGSRIGQVEAIDTIGTDPYRLNSYTLAFASNQYGLYPDSRYRFTRFRKTNGYANHPLDGIWLRAPYLHNGSVPTLRDLLDPPESRPKTFYRGYDVYDQARMGFVSDVAGADGQVYTRYDTSVPGNGNSGHIYGTTLSDDDKRAIVEYMKTF